MWVKADPNAPDDDARGTNGMELDKRDGNGSLVYEAEEEGTGSEEEYLEHMRMLYERYAGLSYETWGSCCAADGSL